MTASPWWLAFAAALLAAAVYLTVPGVPSLVGEAVEVLASNNIERARTWVMQFGVVGPTIILLFMATTEPYLIRSRRVREHKRLSQVRS